MAPKRTTKPRTARPKPKPPTVPADLSTPMEAPASGATVRMYRQGHGDCFLLAFRQADGRPYYVLIDCGMKKGSELTHSMKVVAENIRDATGGHLNLVVITHEHEDHVSGFLSQEAVFGRLTVDRLWLAWTEDPDDELANQLRAKYTDTLLGLLAAAERLNGLGAVHPSCARTHRIVDSLLGYELSDADRQLAADHPDRIRGRRNKDGILVIKRQADRRGGTAYLRPHAAPLSLPSVPGVRVFVLGPPENEPSLRDMDPRGGEQFDLAAAEERSFRAAVADDPAEREAHQPFEARYRIPQGQVATHEEWLFFKEFYGVGDAPGGRDDALSWRRIDGDWLHSSEMFALRMSNYVNNTSLVLAFELPRTSKVLLFVGDAQRGNWVSWHARACPDGAGGEVKVTDLLGRTVFYKVGHHGSHNATLNAGGLKAMAAGPFADEFVAMIPANEQWATTANDPPWRHPLRAIHEALRKKAKGRVFVMDRDLKPPAAQVLSQAEWAAFLGRAKVNDLFYEFTVPD